jgi:hypothetical protein
MQCMQSLNKPHENMNPPLRWKPECGGLGLSQQQLRARVSSQIFTELSLCSFAMPAASETVSESKANWGKRRAGQRWK